jgi:hypothetical protein
MQRIEKEKRDADNLLRASEIQLAIAGQSRADGMVGKAAEQEQKAETMKQAAAKMAYDVKADAAKILGGIEQHKISAAATAAAANKPQFEMELMKSKLGAKLAADPSIANDPVKLATAQKESFSEAARETRTAAYGQQRAETASDVAYAKMKDNSTKAVDGKLIYDRVFQKLNRENPEAAEAKRQEMIANDMAGKVRPDSAAAAPKDGSPAAAAAAKATAPAFPPVVPEAVNMLKQDPTPENRKYFDNTFGPGAAARALGK